MKKMILLSGLMVILSINVFASDLSFLTHNLQGQTYVDETGELRGKNHGGKRAFDLEIVREMMRLMKHSKPVEEMPFVRALKMVQNQPGLALFNVIRTVEREHTVKWVGPLQREIDYFYEMKNAPTGITSLEDAKKVDAICVLNGSIHHKILQQKDFRNIVPNVSYVGCLKMLEKGRVNLTPSGGSTISQKLEQAGVVPGIIRQTPVVLLKSDGYIAFSKEIPDTTIQKWQDAFEQIKESGKYRELYEQYFSPEKPQ